MIHAHDMGEETHGREDECPSVFFMRGLLVCSTSDYIKYSYIGDIAYYTHNYFCWQ